jgi:UDP-N-acetylmuramoylalanine--D-glutamate ligase
LYSLGVPFSVIDTRTKPPGLDTLRAQMPDVDVYAGDYPDELITSAAELIVSPGIALDDPLVVAAREAGVEILGDIDLFVREAQAPVIGITGSNAKSTVTELVGEMARQSGINVGVGGNLGTPALDLLGTDRELYVLELSSFQLERAGKLGLAVATVLNISPDHLDRHGSMVKYHQAKHRIFFGCGKAVVHTDDALTVPLLEDKVPVVRWRLGEPALDGFGLRLQDGEEFICLGLQTLLPVTAVRMAGRHNLANALAALALGQAAGLPLAIMLDTLQQFPGLPHRCEVVADIDGVRFVNDSKGTNVGATQAALEGLGGDRDILLIAGGLGKGANFRELIPAVTRHCRQVFTIGEDAELIADALGTAVTVSHASSLDGAVQQAAQLAQAGDTVLLSPACASFDMFPGFVARGEAFAAAVHALGEAS